MINAHPAGLFEVYYDDNEKQSLCRYLTVATYELLDARQRSCWTKEIAGVTRPLSKREILIASRIATGLLSLLLKDSCYFYEREVRLLHLSLRGLRPKMMQFKIRKTGHSRHYLPWTTLADQNSVFPIAAVHFGPRSRKTREQKEIVKICAERNIPVANSKLPYRGANAPKLSWGQMVKRLVQIEKVMKRAFSKSKDSTRQMRISSHWKTIEAQAKLWNQEHKRPRSK